MYGIWRLLEMRSVCEQILNFLILHLRDTLISEWFLFFKIILSWVLLEGSSFAQNSQPVAHGDAIVHHCYADVIFSNYDHFYKHCSHKSVEKLRKILKMKTLIFECTWYSKDTWISKYNTDSIRHLSLPITGSKFLWFVSGLGYLNTRVDDFADRPIRVLRENCHTAYNSTFTVLSQQEEDVNLQL